MFGFIDDLNEYFCEKYENYDKICLLPGYVMPKMQTTKRGADGYEYAYTLPASTMKLSLQKNKENILREFKERAFDPTFSFSFRPLSFFERIKEKFSKYAFRKHFGKVTAKYSLTPRTALDQTAIGEKTKKRILSGAYVPTKNLIFSLALANGFSAEDTETLLALCTLSYDFTVVKDVVVAYLVENKVTNREMIDAALAEFKVKNLFLKEKE